MSNSKSTCALDLSYVLNADNQTLDLHTNQSQTYGTIAYVRGLEDHPLRESFPFVQTLERALNATKTMLPPSRESTWDEDAWGDDVDYSDDPRRLHHTLIPSGGTRR